MLWHPWPHQVHSTYESRSNFPALNDGKRCEMFSHKPGGKMNLLGTFNSKHDAEKAMKEMKQCNNG